MLLVTVVHQTYQTDVNVEHVIRGNSAIVKCSIPSFVADYLAVETWLVDNDDIAGRHTDHWGILIAYPRIYKSLPNPPTPSLPLSVEKYSILGFDFGSRKMRRASWHCQSATDVPKTDE